MKISTVAGVFFLLFALTFSWSAFAQAPTNNPTGFNVSAFTSSSLTVSWVNVADPNRTNYLILVNTGAITDPVTGTGVTDDTDLSDGVGAINIAGTATTQVWSTGLSASTLYNFKIYAYNSSGTKYLLTADPATSRKTLAAAPATQATALVFSAQLQTGLGYTVSYTAAAGSPSGYVVLRKAGATPPAGPPVDGTSYTVGNATADGTVAYVGSALTFNETALTAATQYSYAVFSYNGSGTDDAYFLTGPLTGTVSTLAAVPTAQPTALNFSSLLANGQGFTVSYTAATGSPTGYIAIRKAGSAPTADTPVDGTNYTAGTSIGGSTVAFIGSAVTFNETTLTPNTVYFYDIYSYNGGSGTYNFLLTAPLAGSQTTYAAVPTAQPTILGFSSLLTNGQGFTVSFTAAAGTPDGYIAIRKAGSAPTADVPVIGTTYTAGATLGTSKVAYVGSAVTFNESALTVATNYFYDIYSYNGTTGSYNYLTTAPLAGSQTTLAALPTAQPTALNFSSILANGQGFTVSYTAATGSPTGYIAIRKQGSAPTADTPVNGTTYTAGNTIGTSTVAYIGSAVTFNETTLTPSTQYFYDIYSYNGASGTFNYRLTTPLAGNQSTGCSAPTNPATTAAFGTTTGGSIVVNWARGNGDNVLVLAYPASVTFPPVSGTDYSSQVNLDISNGTDLGGGFAVYVGTGTTATVVGLDPSTTYDFKIYEFNNTNFCYIATAANETKMTGSHSTTNTITNTGGAAPTITSITTVTPGVGVFSFKVNDLGGDGNKTLISGMVIRPGPHNAVADWTQLIAGAVLTDGTNPQTSNITIHASDITITSIANAGNKTQAQRLGNVDDTNSKTYTLEIFLKTSLGGTLPSSIDGTIVDFSIDATDITVSSSGSIFAGSQNGPSGDNTVSVTATQINTLTAPSTAANAFVALATEPKYNATDVHNNLDLGFTFPLTVTATGLTPASAPAGFVSGVVDFAGSGFNFQTTGTAPMSVTANAISSAPSSAITVSASTTLGTATAVNPGPNLINNSTTQVVFGFSLTTSGSSLTFNTANITSSLNLTSTNPNPFSNFKLYKSATDNFGAATVIGGAGVPSGTSLTFSTIATTITGTITYFYVTADVALFFTSANPTAQFSLTPGNVTVSTGSVIGSTVTGINYTLKDNTAPTISSIVNNVNPIFEGALTQTVVVTFSESMNPAINPVIALSGADWGAQAAGGWSTGTYTNDTYTTTFVHSATQETVPAAVAKISTATPQDWGANVISNTLPFSSALPFVLDNQKPTVSSIVASPTTISTVATDVTFVIVFNETMTTGVAPVINLTDTHFAVQGVPVWSTGTNTNDTYTIVYRQNGFVETTAGVTASVNSAKDFAGNIQTASATSNGFLVDTNPPTAAITYDDPDGFVKQGQVLRITATFSEAMASAPVMQVALSGANTIALTNMTFTDATHYYYDFTVGAGNGLVTVALGTGTDVAGNPITSAPTSGATFTVDNTIPGLTTLNPSNNQLNVTVSTGLTLTFAEKVVGTGTNDIQLIDWNGGAPTVVQTFSSTTVFGTNTVTALTSQTITPSSSLSQDHEYYVIVNNGAVADRAGNPFGGITSTPGDGNGTAGNTVGNYDWFFTSFGAASITGVPAKACVGTTVTLTGKFFTGVDKIFFGTSTTNARPSATAISDVSVTVTVPADAVSGAVTMTKTSGTTGINTAIANPATATGTSSAVPVGPRSAQLFLTGTNLLCDQGTSSTQIKVVVDGDHDGYDVVYQDLVSSTLTPAGFSSGYPSNTVVSATPTPFAIADNATKLYTYSLVSVKESIGNAAAGCVVPLAALTVSGSTNVTVRKKSVVDAHPTSPTFCLTSGPTIALSGTIHGTITTGTWTGTGTNAITNPTNLTGATYAPSLTDALAGFVIFTLTSSNTNAPCSLTVDTVKVSFTAQAQVSAGPDVTVCPGAPTVQLHGSAITPGATGTWAVTGSANGTFSLTTAFNPIYTLGSNDNLLTSGNHFTLKFTPGAGTCTAGPADLVDVYIGQPITVTTGSQPSPGACIGGTYNYSLANAGTTSTFAWTVPAGGTILTPNNGLNSSAIDVTWTSSVPPNTISVIETRSDGCTGSVNFTPLAVNPLPGPLSIKYPTGNVFGKQLAPVPLFGQDSLQVNGFANFSGSGVTDDGGSPKKKYFFSPSLLSPGDYTINYSYTNATTLCANSLAPVTFTVFDGSSSIIIAGTRGPSEQALAPQYCADLPKVTVQISQNLVPLIQSGEVFAGFAGPGISNNLAGVALNNNDGTADFSPSDPALALGGRYTITYSVQNTTTLAIRQLGSQDVFINLVPILAPDGLVNSEFCSTDAPVNLSRNSSSNPTSNFQFFIDPALESAHSGINAALITGNSTSGFVYRPSSIPSVPGILPTLNTFDPLPVSIFYAYQDANGCNDTTSIATSLATRITLQPPKPTIGSINSTVHNGDVLCVTTNAIGDVEIANQVTNGLGPASVAWYNNGTLSGVALSTNASFTPNLTTTVNSRTSYYLIQRIGSCSSPVDTLTYEVYRPTGFTWDKSIIDPASPVHYTATPSGSVTASLTWQILDQAGNALSSPVVNTLPGPSTFAFDFSTLGPGLYQSSLSAQSTLGCPADSIAKTVILAKKTATPTSSYAEDFSTDGGWVATGTNSSWAFGTKTPFGVSTINMASTGWVTGLTAPYNNGEKSYLYLPAMDITQLQRPLITFDSWTDTNPGNDGAVLQYSVDDKIVEDPTKVWVTLGVENDGQYWYNVPLVQANPSGTIAEPYGWSKADTLLRSTKHTLDDPGNALANAITSSVNTTKTAMFRFAFGAILSQGLIVPDKGGFSVDNVFIGNRTRTVLIENFRNTGNSAADEKSVNDAINLFVERNIGTQLLMVNYDVSFPGPDPFNQDNQADPGARALYYNVTTTPRSRLDGSDGGQPGSPFTTWGVQNYNLETLQLGLASIDMSGTQVQSDSIKVAVSITPTINLDHNTVLHIAVVEDTITASTMPQAKLDAAPIKSNETAFKYILKKMLPSAIGTMTGAMQSNNVYPFTLSWQPNKSALYPNPATATNEDLSVIAFLQNDSSKVVYQSEIKHLNYTIPLVTGLEPIPDDQIKVYPNPADQQLTIELPGVMAKDMPLHIIDQVGRTVNSDEIKAGSQRKVISTAGMSAGLYIIELGSGNGSVARKKIIVVHDK